MGGAIRRKRYVTDGRLCASRFVFEGQVYRGCTTAKNPDGNKDNKEWCYVAKDAVNGGTKWGHCKGVLDYDKVRIRARELMEEHVRFLRKVI